MSGNDDKILFVEINKINVARWSAKRPIDGKGQECKSLSLYEYIEWLKKNNPSVWTPAMADALPRWEEAARARLHQKRT